MNRAKVFMITITNLATKQNFINTLNAMAEVLYAEANVELTTNVIPVDGRFNQQWGMRNLTVPGADIHLDGATNIFTGNPNSIIAVIDNGVERVHNDLDAKILGGDNGFAIDSDPFNPTIQWSHGSHVAGIAAAVSNNPGNNGVAGVDWQARIHPKNIFDGNGIPDITQSIIDAVNFSANVWTFNHSWGLTNGRDEQNNPIPGSYSVTVRSAFAQAYRNNRVQCVAMGNHQNYTGGRYANVVAFPAGFNSGVIAVGASNINDNIAGFSAQGLHIDVSAPGVDIVSTNFNNGYINLQGTSMASPHAAGLASLLKGFNTNLANDDIEQVIRLTADDANAANGFPGFDNQMGTGRINAQRALQALQAPNTLQQLSTTSGTVFSTSASMTRVFLGVPGFPDAAYIVKRIEVRKDITLPTMCSTVGVWGRGVGTTGYREERNRTFGEGFCEVVPGTLTATGCTLRTWIYEVFSASGQNLGFYPRSASNVVFQYTILGVFAPVLIPIQGTTLICNTSDYFIVNLPAGASVAWSIPEGNFSVLELAQNTPLANRLRITNKKWYGINTILKATINNVAGCTINPPFLTKIIANDNNTSSTANFNYYQEACIAGNVNHPSQSGTTNGATFVHSGCTVTVSADLTGKTVSFTGSIPPLMWATTSNGFIFQLPLNAGGIPFTFNISGNGACFTQQLLFFAYSNNGRYAFTATPNPVNDILSVKASENMLQPLNSKSKFTNNNTQFTFNIFDVNTNKLQLIQKGNKGVLRHQINTSQLKKGYYILQIKYGDKLEAIKFLKE
jgi:hypothetical protein